MLTNARSKCLNKINRLDLIMSEVQYDLLAITEAWLDNSYNWCITYSATVCSERIIKMESGFAFL